MNKCLYCYKDLSEGEHDYHTACAKKLFGTGGIPQLPYNRSQISDLAKEVIRSQTTLTGVQAKLSLDLPEKMADGNRRFTIVGMWGRFILKPQTDLYPNLPELEDLVMHLAEASRIAVVPHSLIRFDDNELAYITKRIDRTDKGEKIPMEDMCQLTEHLTEHKYRGSYEQIAKAIARFSAAPQLDVSNFYDQVLFSWIVGNADMHLKNYSLIQQPEGYRLSKAYDLLSTAVAIPSDTEELALTLNGKKRKLSRNDFITAMTALGIPEKSGEKLFKKYLSLLPKWEAIIARSFLPQQGQAQLLAIIENRLSRLQPI